MQCLPQLANHMGRVGGVGLGERIGGQGGRLGSRLPLPPNPNPNTGTHLKVRVRVRARARVRGRVRGRARSWG
jgi:hypothetical protein